MSNRAIVKASNLKKVFSTNKGFLSPKKSETLKAVDGVSFQVKEGETLGLVGESGCGKSTTAKIVLRLISPNEGRVEFKGKNIYDYDREELRKLRKNMQIVFQDPYSSLNPRKTVASIINFPMKVLDYLGKQKRKERVSQLLEEVGLDQNYSNRYPHQFSGGQRQRIGLARAVAVNPDFLVLDEPVSALDVSIQAQILNLLQRFQNELNLSYLFIAHDLNVVEYMSDQVAVMYLGKIVEIADHKNLYKHPAHPYTRSLLSSVLTSTSEKPEKLVLDGEIPSPTNLPSGCNFNTRCYRSRDKCLNEEPILEEKRESHFAACHFPHSKEESIS